MNKLVSALHDATHLVPGAPTHRAIRPPPSWPHRTRVNPPPHTQSPHLHNLESAPPNPAARPHHLAELDPPAHRASDRRPSKFVLELKRSAIAGVPDEVEIKPRGPSLASRSRSTAPLVRLHSDASEAAAVRETQRSPRTAGD